jgi:hypothetical protein
MQIIRAVVTNNVEMDACTFIYYLAYLAECPRHSTFQFCKLDANLITYITQSLTGNVVDVITNFLKFFPNFFSVYLISSYLFTIYSLTVIDGK